MSDTKKEYNIEKLRKARETADLFAKSQGKENINELVNPIREGLNSSDTVQVELSKQLARGAVEQLTKLILKQELFTTPDAPYIKWVNVFDDGVVKEGNAKLYDFNHPTGSDTYDANQFIPTATSVPDVSEFTIKMYGDNGQLNTNQAYQFRKSLVYIESKWIPYFKNGNLVQFIAQLQSQLDKTWKMFIFDKIVRKITGQTYKKTITGTAPNAFECWSSELLPEIRKMLTLSSDYNINSNSTALVSSDPSDLMILAHPKVIQTLESGIKSQLFNAKLLNMKSVIDENNFIDCGKQLTISTDNSDTVITAGASYYVAENTIYVISKKAFKHFSQINAVETQFYARNMSFEVVMHKWGAADFLPWGQAFKYTNNNLTVLP